jgi:hypothetical protein
MEVTGHLSKRISSFFLKFSDEENTEHKPESKEDKVTEILKNTQTPLGQAVRDLAKSDSNYDKFVTTIMRTLNLHFDAKRKKDSGMSKEESQNLASHMDLITDYLTNFKNQSKKEKKIDKMIDMYVDNLQKGNENQANDKLKNFFLSFKHQAEMRGVEHGQGKNTPKSLDQLKEDKGVDPSVPTGHSTLGNPEEIVTEHKSASAAMAKKAVTLMEHLNKALEEKPVGKHLKGFDYTDWLFTDVLGIKKTEWDETMNTVNNFEKICQMAETGDKTSLAACQSVTDFIVHKVIPKLKPFFDPGTPAEQALAKKLKAKKDRTPEENEQLKKLTHNLRPDKGANGSRYETLLTRIHGKDSQEKINKFKDYFKATNRERMNPTSDNKKKVEDLKANGTKEIHDKVRGAYEEMKKHYMQVKNKFMELQHGIAQIVAALRKIQITRYAILSKRLFA